MPLTEQTTTSLPRLPASQESTIMIVDAMATIQMAKFGGVSTFGQLASITIYSLHPCNIGTAARYTLYLINTRKDLLNQVSI